MSTLSLAAPAKINLSLRILKKREDGFHEIDSLMVQLPGLHDQLDVEPADAFAFSCSDPSLSCDEDNLVVKAVRAYEQASGTPCRYRIHLQKNIPHGAGLGGGSSDAATTLLALNQLNDGKLSHRELQRIAASLGSDIPFFLQTGAARARGRGERIDAVDGIAPIKVLLLKPEFGVATPDAYQRWQTSRAIPGIAYDPQCVGDLTLTNDLERPVFAKHRFLAEVKAWLLNRPDCRAALLCGSGSTVFAVLGDDANPTSLTHAARQELDPKLWSWSGMTGE